MRSKRHLKLEYADFRPTVPNSVAFLGFMSVAGIPAFLEERAVFLREKRNGLYRAMPYALANTVVTIRESRS